jgi:hypothetical protein
VVFKDVFNGIEKVMDPVAVSDAKRAPNPLLDSPDTNNPMSIDILGRGGMNITYKYWTPDKIGTHYIKVVVDPNDVIKEFNEENNEFVSELNPTNVFVDAITLVVDDDQQTVGAVNATNEVVKSLDFLGYKYEIFTVNAASSFNGPGIDKLTRYNSVIWVLGNEAANTLKKEDTTNLSSYLVNYDDSKLFIIGQNLANDNTVWSNLTFRRALLGIGGGTLGAGTPASLYGIKNNNITHGMQYATTNTFADGADRLTPWTGAETIFTNSASQPYAIAFNNRTGANYKVVTMGFEFSFINKADYRNELMFQVLRWFGQVENRIELKVTYDDMFFGQDNGPSIPFNSLHPVLGDSYILQAKIWNMGGTPGGAVVRFVDGSTVINSVNVYVPATTWDSSGTLIPGTAIAEVIWTPLFAGSRPITVKVDPDQNIPVSGNPRDTTGELFKFNNNAVRSIIINFFYDDMEDGPTAWTHDATILNINGEQPIEYFDRLRPVDTNVISQWDQPINPWQQDLTDGHSLPTSYKVVEPLDLNMSPMLRISVCVDDSGSMRAAPWASDPNYQRLDAIQNFIDWTLNDGDELALYRLDYTNNNGDFGGAARVTNLYQAQYGLGLWEGYPYTNSSGYLSSRLFPNQPYPVAGNYENVYFNNMGGTPLYDCIVQALNDQVNNYNPPVFMFPALIVLTDGLDAASVAQTYTSAYDRIASAGIPVYTVGLGGAVDDNILFSLAEKSNGGKYYFAASADVLNATFKHISDAIGSGVSRSAEESTTDTNGDYGPSSRETGSSRNQITDMRLLNPSRSGAYAPSWPEKWGVGSSINVSWRCVDNIAGDQAISCGHATIQVSLNGGGNWNVVANNVGTRVDNVAGWTYGLYDRQSANWFTNYIYVYNWTVPSIVGNQNNNVLIRVTETARNGVVFQRDSRPFTIFNMGINVGAALPATEKKIISNAFQLTGYQSARLNFWQRYDMLFGENGGVIQIGTSNLQAGPYTYKYIQPTQTYTGNLRLQSNQQTGVTDGFGNPIVWAWNGRSGGGTYSWEYVEVNLDQFIGKWVKVKFSFYTWGFGNGGGWWIDDVTVKATRSNSVAITPAVADQWQYYQWTSGVDSPFLQPHSGTHMWWNHNPAAANDAASGIDNSLYTRAIDLTNAKDASLSAYFMFNYNDAAGRPPDGFRVEVSPDNGVTWSPVNLGVRSSWGVSGHWSVDGKSPDNKQAYTGIQDSGVDSATPVWVEAGSMWRLNTNLTGWAGQVIKIRFRVVTNLAATHYKANTVFKGLAIDDVMVRGNSTISGAPIPQVQDYGLQGSGTGNLNNGDLCKDKMLGSTTKDLDVKKEFEK